MAKAAISIEATRSEVLAAEAAKINITIVDSVFEENRILIDVDDGNFPFAVFAPTISGGALSVTTTFQSQIQIYASIFRRNSIRLRRERAESVQGGAIKLELPHSSSKVSVTSSIFVANVAEVGDDRKHYDDAAGDCAGGALSVRTFGQVYLRNSTFSENLCVGGKPVAAPSGHVHGGAVAVLSLPKYEEEASPSLSVLNCTFSSNAATGRSSAHAHGGALVFIAERASALEGAEATVDILDSLFVDNSITCLRPLESTFSEDGGGAVFVSMSRQRVSQVSLTPVKIVSSQFLSNTVYFGALNFFYADPGLNAGGAVSLVLSLQLAIGVYSSELIGTVFVGNGLLTPFPLAVLQNYANGGAVSLVAFGTAALIENCQFSGSYTQGMKGSTGGAVFGAVTELFVFDSTFVNSSLSCEYQLGAPSADATCLGGHIYAVLGLVAARSSFVGASLVGTGCVRASGGAIYANTANVENSTFSGHFISGS